MDTNKQARARLSLIAALSENRAIAREGKIPWNLPGDARRYREKIAGRVIIAGRKTFDRTYGNDVSIVVTRRDDYVPPIPATIVGSVDAALQSARDKLTEVHADKRDEIFVLGGGEIFHQTIAMADRLYLTIIHRVIEGDTFFPDFSAFARVVRAEDREEDGYRYTFLDLERSHCVPSDPGTNAIVTRHVTGHVRLTAHSGNQEMRHTYSATRQTVGMKAASYRSFSLA